MIKITARFIIGLALLFILVRYPIPAQAAVSSCTANVSLTSLSVDTSTAISFSLNNTSSQTISWIRVTRPSSNFTITGGAATTWTASTSDSTATFTGGSLAPSTVVTLNISITTGSTPASTANWTVEVSDVGGGSSPTSCTGTLGTKITGSGPAPTISNIIVSNVTDSSVLINWTTDIDSNSQVDYGTTDSYGSTKTNSAYISSHSLAISGLSANTTYHYDVASEKDAENALLKGAVKYIVKSEYEPKKVVEMVNEIIAAHSRDDVPGS